jgi:hypothetical protein
MLRRFVSVLVLRRWRNRVEAWRLVRPDEQDTARRVVDDESCLAPEAVWTEPRVVAVSRHDEQISVLHCRYRLAFGTTATAFRGDVATEPSRGSRKELRFRQACRGLDGIPGIDPTTASTTRRRSSTKPDKSSAASERAHGRAGCRGWTRQAPSLTSGSHEPDRDA